MLQKHKITVRVSAEEMKTLISPCVRRLLLFIHLTAGEKGHCLTVGELALWIGSERRAVLSLMNLLSQRGDNCHQRQCQNELGGEKMIRELWKSSPLPPLLPPGLRKPQRHIKSERMSESHGNELLLSFLSACVCVCLCTFIPFAFSSACFSTNLLDSSLVLFFSQNGCAAAEYQFYLYS